jgi:hypothetical protein
VVVTDGDDCLSPGEYRGARGMNPLMRELKDRGFNIEWCACECSCVSVDGFHHCVLLGFCVWSLSWC